ncbi:MAG: tetratricopeptide repeat protein [Acidobacteria bacterium]|nr:tetratricopeptide repeat protein [Acidobacteriota bacterium]
MNERRLLAVILALLLGAAVPAAQPDAPPVLVMPFVPAPGQPRTAWLGEGVSVLLSDLLEQRGIAIVTRDERLRAFERLQLPHAADLSRATVIRAGQVVGAGHIVSGSVDVSGDDLLVAIRALRLDSGRILPEIVERGALNTLYEIVERLADRLARSNPLPRVAPIAAQAPRPGAERDAATPVTPARDPTGRRPPLPAFEQYVKGLQADSPAAQTSFLQSALDRFDGYEEARLALWRVRTLQGDHASALRHAEAIPAHSALRSTAQFLAGLSHISLQRYDAAFATLKALLDRHAVAPLFNNLGVIQLRRPASAEIGRAPYYFTRAAELGPEDGDYFFNLGYAYLKERDTQAAIYWLREAVRRSPVDGEAHFLLSIALAHAHAAAEAAREKELAARLAPGYETLEKSRTGAGDGLPPGLERVKQDLKPDRATELEASLFKTEQREQQQLASFYLDRGRRMFDAERDRDAMADLRRSLYLSPYQAEPHLLLGRLYLRGGRHREAIDELKMSIWSRDTVAAHLVLAQVYEQANDPEAARAALERVLQLTGDDPGSSERKEAEEMLRRLK